MKIQEFTPEIIEELKSYVYLYIEPDTDKVFYIGKGKGNRCFEHLLEESNSDKVNKIKELSETNQKPLIELLRFGLTDNEASLLESALLDFVGIKGLTNIVRGLHSRTYGRTSIEDINLKYTAEDVEIEENALLITINKMYYSRITESELYEFTRGVWKLGKRREKVEFVFSVYQGIIREVFKVISWHKAGTLEYEHRNSTDISINGRWEFEGKKANEAMRKKYIGKSVRKYIARGSQNPIKYIKS